MKKESAIKKLNKLKNFKKYSGLSEETIKLAIKIISNEWVKEQKDIELRTCEDHISIDMCILGFIPIVYLIINNEGKVRIGHYIDEYKDISSTKKGQTGLEKVKNRCSCFNFLCGEVRVHKKSIEARFMKEFKKLKTGSSNT
jgi:hypothetical protein